jgi:hypothetical protein
MVNEDLSLDKPLHVIYKVSKLSYRIWVIVIANKRVKKNSSPVSSFSDCPELSMPFKHPFAAHAFFLELLSNHFQSLGRTLSEVCTTFNAHSLSDPSLTCFRPDKWLQKKRKKSVLRSSFLKCFTLAPNWLVPQLTVANVLLQMFYRWQQQSWKLWIPVRALQSDSS